MSAEQERPNRRLAGLAAAALIAIAALASTAPGAQAAVQASPGATIAAALRKSPLYIDPSLASAFPSAMRASLLREIRRAPAPVFILAVPLASGGNWSSGDQLAAVVHNDLGRAGIYLTLDAEITGNIDAYTWPSDPQGLDAPPYHAADAAQAVDLEQDMQSATMAQRFLTCIKLISDGQAVAAYNAATAQLNDGTTASSGTQPKGGNGGGGPWLVIGIVVLILAGAGSGSWLMVRRRRPQLPPVVTPHSVFSAARTATETELRGQAEQQVIALGELVEQPGPPGGGAGPQAERAQQLLARALDAYQAAGKVLDSASGLCDLAGVLVLVHIGRGAALSGQALQAGRPAPASYPLCFFNPLHGEGSHQTRWRALGQRDALDVHACDECAAAAGQHRPPDALLDGGIPYYEADPRRSVWAATGYGQFGSDLAQRILTGGLRPAR